MDSVMILCCCGGWWKFTSDNHESYKGGSSSVLRVRRNISYNELIDQLAHEFGINLMENSVRLRCVFRHSSSSSFTATESVPSLFITDIKQDRDVDCFLEANINTSRFGGGLTPLFLSSQAVSHVFPNLPAFGLGSSSSGSNALTTQFFVSQHQVCSETMPLYENQVTNLGLINSPLYDCGPSTQYTSVFNDGRLSDEVRNDECSPDDVEIVPKNRHSWGDVFGVSDVRRESQDPLNWIPPVSSPSIIQFDAMSSCNDCEMVVGKVYGVCAFPNATHGVCAFHVSCNLKSKFKFQKSNWDQFMVLFFLAAKAYRISEFNELMDNMRLIHPTAVKYLEEDVGVQRWARAHFCSHRYNIMTTNIAECLNRVLRHARELPITNLVEHIRNMLQAWFFKRKTDACEYLTHLTPWAHVQVEESKEQGRTMRVEPIEKFRFVVKDSGKDGIVDLTSKCCSCRAFQLDQLPCAHALAALRYNNFCSDYYTTEYLIGAYGEPINTVGHQSDWVFFKEIQFDVNPPIQRRPCGRRKKQRIPSNGEEIQHKKCSCCKQLGHNRQTCKNPIVRLGESDS